MPKSTINPSTGNIDLLGDGLISSVSNSDSTLTISPTTGAVVASLNLAKANTWTGAQTFNTSAAIFNVAPRLTTLSVAGIPYIGTNGTISTDLTNLLYNSTLTSLGMGAGSEPTAKIDIRSILTYSITTPASIVLTATIAAEVAAPSVSEITVSNAGDIAADGSFSGASETDVGSGNFIASSQTINYVVFGYRTFNGTPYYSGQLGTTSYTDSSGDSHSFNVSVSWNPWTGAEGYIIGSDGGTGSWYYYDVGSTTSVTDQNGSFNSGFSVGSPSQSMILSTGGSRNYRARTIATSLTGSTYYSAAYNYTLTEPTSGYYYVALHSSIAIVTDGTSNVLYGANDGSTTFTNSATLGVQNVYERLSAWGSDPPFDGATTQTPTSWGITGAGQTVLYRMRGNVNFLGYNEVFGSGTVNSNNLTIPNTGSKYYITATIGTPSTTAAPSGLVSVTRYYIDKSTNNGSSFALYRLASAGTLWSSTTFYEDVNTSYTAGSYTASPTTFGSPAANFQSSGPTTGPYLSTASASLQSIYASNSSAQYAGFEIRSGANRSMACYGVSTSAFIGVTGTLTIENFGTGDDYLKINGTQTTIGNTTTGQIFMMPNSTYTSGFFYVNANAAVPSVTIGATSGSGIFSIVGHTNMSTNNFFSIKQHASTNGNFVKFDNSSGVQLFTIDNNGAFVANDNGADADCRIEGDSLTHMIFTDGSAATENIALLAAAAPNWQSMDRGLFIGNATTVPTGDPSSGGFLYVESGALKYRGSSGTITTLGAA